MPPETRYVRSGDVHIAYQIVGDGPRDLVYVPTWISQFEHLWEEPRIARYFERLASFSRLILFDRRGSGCPTRWSTRQRSRSRWTTSVRCMDAAGSERAAVYAQLEAGAMAALFAATHPERTQRARALRGHASHVVGARLRLGVRDEEREVGGHTPVG